MRLDVLLSLAVVVALLALPGAAQPTVRYTALSDAARKAGKLARYDSCSTGNADVKLADLSLHVSVPRTARAYDVIPIKYTVLGPSSNRRCAVEAVAFEDAKRAGSRSLYDLAIPGEMGVKLEYLGSVSADFDQSSYIPLTADPKTPVSPFPPYRRDPEVRSSSIRQAEAVWFHFRLTNTGDTILDPEGFGASFLEPRIARIGADGKDEWSAGTVNSWERFLNYLYPGDSHEFWINFYTPKLGGKWCRGLTSGDYRIDLKLLYRYHREYNWGVNIWTGAECARLTVPIRVTEKGGETPVEPTFKVTDAAEKMPGDYEAFEEFMTAFRVYSPSPQPSPARGEGEGRPHPRSSRSSGICIPDAGSRSSGICIPDAGSGDLSPQDVEPGSATRPIETSPPTPLLGGEGRQEGIPLLGGEGRQEGIPLLGGEGRQEGIPLLAGEGEGKPHPQPLSWEERGVLYLQVAPWTTQVVVKLILTDPKEIAVARVPIKITTETLDIRYNPKNVMVVTKDGREEPAFVAQAMPAIRTGFQLGPYPEEHMLREIREMKDLGVNVIANTSGGWWTAEISGRKEVELHSACYKYWYDVLVPKMGMTLMGWSVYPPSGIGWYDNAAPFFGGKKPTYATSPSVYGSGAGVDMADPMVPDVIAAWARYNHARWGDRWFRTRDGRVPVDIEDTWGWMRDDINVRYRSGPLTLQRFRDWVKARYGSIDEANKAWSSSYASFDEIDPEKDQGVEGDGMDHGPVYNKPENTFHDWSPAVEDWDTFRTELRMEVYRKANEIMRRDIPGAELALRCEGANLTIPGDGKSDNMHWRHVYYSQRRNAMVQSVVDRANVLHFFSDYTTLPYTEEEWRTGMRQMVSRGIIPVFLPQFDHMRDILLQPHHGREYQMHYNLEKPTKGMMVHCLMAAYPWWKATYEEGGAPGIIWSDYMCDGFATETQKRELKLLRERFGKMRRK